MALAGGSINFNGGTVQLTSASDWATLNTNAITFNGATLNIAFSGGAVSCDLIKGTTCTIQAGTINVNQIGNLNPNLGPWTLIQATAGNITGDFSTVKLPPGIMENPVTNTWSCKPK